MRISIVAVGRLGRGPERDLFERFAARLSWPLEVREVEERRRPAGPDRRRGEAALLRAACPRGAVVVALDRRGAALSSEDMAARLARWRDAGRRGVAFVIGGPDGLDDGFRAAAELALSFGAVTWPHLLMRALLAEQLYRAQQILARHPYHRSG